MKKINLSIPKPCHENWSNMTSVDKGRFCASCQKTVMDFTGMSDRQLAAFFKKPAGSVCGRFQQEQLNRDIEIPRKHIPWIKYFFRFSLPAFLVSMKAGAQGKVEIKRDTTVCNIALGRIKSMPVTEIRETIEIKGKVTDAKGNALPFVTIMVKGTKIGTTSDTMGNFSLKVNKKEDCTLVASCIGFQMKEIQVVNPLVNITMTAISLDYALMGVIVNVPTKKLKKIPLIKQIIDTAFKNFSVYPNPVQSNSTMKIDLKKMQKGNYAISILNMAGEVIQTEEISVENKNQPISLHLNETAAGTYFIHVFNRKTAASCSEKIVVQ